MFIKSFVDERGVVVNTLRLEAARVVVLLSVSFCDSAGCGASDENDVFFKPLFSRLVVRGLIAAAVVVHRFNVR